MRRLLTQSERDVNIPYKSQVRGVGSLGRKYFEQSMISLGHRGRRGHGVVQNGGRPSGRIAVVDIHRRQRYRGRFWKRCSQRLFIDINSFAGVDRDRFDGGEKRKGLGVHDLHPKRRYGWELRTVVVVVLNAACPRSERVSWGNRWKLRETRQPRGWYRFRIHRLRRLGGKGVRVRGGVTRRAESIG